MSSLLTTCLLAVTVTLAPVRVVAAPSVEDLYTQGQEKFDAGEFGSAAALWAEAVRTIPEDDDNTQTRQTVMNLALDAYVRAYGQSRDRAQLDAAVVLLADYKASLGSSGALAMSILDMKDKIDGLIAEHEAANKPEVEAEPEAEAEPELEPEPVNPKPGKGLVIGGAVLLGASAIGIGLLVGGMVGGQAARVDYADAPADSPDRESIRARGVTMNVLAITGGVVGGVLIGGGLALLILGLQKNKAASNQVGVLPVAGPQLVGLGVTGRF